MLNTVLPAVSISRNMLSTIENEKACPGLEMVTPYVELFTIAKIGWLSVYVIYISGR
jgi:hypothetical protein